MAYTIRSRDLTSRTMVIFEAETKRLNNMPMPPKEILEGTREFDEYVEGMLARKPARPDWYNEPGDENPYKRRMPIVDRRSSP